MLFIVKNTKHFNLPFTEDQLFTTMMNDNTQTTKLNCRKLKPSLNMAQEISWSVSLRTAGSFGSFVWSTYESILEQL